MCNRSGLARCDGHVAALQGAHHAILPSVDRPLRSHPLRPDGRVSSHESPSVDVREAFVDRSVFSG